MRVAAVAWLLCLALPARAGEPEWVGLQVPPYPDGLVSNLGACVGSGTTPEEVCAYSIGTLDAADGRALHLFAGRAAGHVGQQARWTITDLIAYPALGRNEYLSIATCERNGVPEAGMAAVVDTRGAGEMYDAVRWAVRLDQGKFVETPTAGIRCYNEGYGE